MVEFFHCDHANCWAIGFCECTNCENGNENDITYQGLSDAPLQYFSIWLYNGDYDEDQE